MVEKIKNKFTSDYESSWSFSISLSDFYKKGSRLNYNSIIRENIPRKNTHGVYLISDSNSKTILYVGMSGQIKKLDDGKYENCDYDIRKRLVSSRGKDKKGKDISSSDYFKSKMEEERKEEEKKLMLMDLAQNFNEDLPPDTPNSIVIAFRLPEGERL